MKLAAAAVLAAIVAVAAPSRPADEAVATTTAERPLLGISWDRTRLTGASLAHYDRATLVPASRARVRLGNYSGAWALSRDGRRVAVGTEAALGVRIIDATRMRKVADVKTRHGAPSVLAWLTPRLLVGAERGWMFAIDPVTRRVLKYVSLDGYVAGHVRTHDTLVVMLGRYEGIGPTQVVIADAAGAIRTVTLDGIHSGSSFPSDGDASAIGEVRTPGLAVDAVARRAFVVGGDNVVAEIDLASLRVAYHALREQVSLVDRVRDWWEPRAYAKGPVLGHDRHAQWLGDGILGVSGDDRLAVGGETGRERVRSEPYGLRLVDVRDWTVRTVDRRARSFAVAGSTLLAYGLEMYYQDDWNFSGSGLRGYTVGGDSRFHLFGDEPIALIVYDGLAYVDRFHVRGVAVVDAERGEVVRELPNPLPELLVDR